LPACTGALLSGQGHTGALAHPDLNLVAAQLVYIYIYTFGKYIYIYIYICMYVFLRSILRVRAGQHKFTAATARHETRVANTRAARQCVGHSSVGDVALSLPRGNVCRPLPRRPLSVSAAIASISRISDFPYICMFLMFIYVYICLYIYADCKFRLLFHPTVGVSGSFHLFQGRPAQPPAETFLHARYEWARAAGSERAPALQRAGELRSRKTRAERTRKTLGTREFPFLVLSGSVISLSRSLSL
jgi:hypothetical protein